MGTSRSSDTAPPSTAGRGRPIDRAWVVLPALLPAIVSLLSSPRATDLAYQVRVGATMLDERALVRIDTLTFSVAGASWVNQQWGAQVVFAILHGVGGWPTLGVVQAAVIGSSFWLVSRTALRRGATVAVASTAAIAGFVVAAPNLGMRPQLLALPLVTLCLWALTERHDRRRVLWVIPVCAIVLANLHGSFVLIPLLVGLAWIEDTLDRSPGRAMLLAVGTFSAAATLVNPFGVDAWRYAWDLSTDEAVRSVSEWAPVSLSSLPGWLMVGSAVVVAWIVARRDEPTPWAALITLTVFFVIAMASQRATLWWAIVAPVTVAPLVARRPDPLDGRLPPPGSPIPATVLVATLVAVAAIALPWWRADAYVDRIRDAPAGITDVLRTLPAGSRVLAHQPWASWFEQEAPNVLVFVDSRIELFPEHVWDAYEQVALAGARWEHAVTRWNPDVIVADAGWALIPELRESPRWHLRYEDADGVVFVRT